MILNALVSPRSRVEIAEDCAQLVEACQHDAFVASRERPQRGVLEQLVPEPAAFEEHDHDATPVPASGLVKW